MFLKFLVFKSDFVLAKLCLRDHKKRQISIKTIVQFLTAKG